MITIQAQLNTKQVQTLRNRLVKLFPVLTTLRCQRRVQMVNACGQFRIIPLNGVQLPTCLTQTMVERMILTIQAEACGGDPTLKAWAADGAPVSNAKWDGDYSGVYGHGEIRLTLASN